MTAPWFEYLRTMFNRQPPPWRPTVDPIPVGRSQMLIAYGNPDPKFVRGKWVADSRWESRNCKTISASLIPGYNRRIYMHNLAAPHFIEGMRRAVEACPEYKFDSIGCFNVRRQRYDTPEKARKEGRRLREWSDHYMAIAYDINRLRNHWAPATLAPWSPGWEKYSDLP